MCLWQELLCQRVELLLERMEVLPEDTEFDELRALREADFAAMDKEVEDKALRKKKRSFWKQVGGGSAWACVAVRGAYVFLVVCVGVCQLLVSEEEEVIAEVMGELKRRKMDKEALRAKLKAQDEHRRMRKIMANWAGMGA